MPLLEIQPKYYSVLIISFALFLHSIRLHASELSCSTDIQTTFIDFNYCKVSESLGKPARWVDRAFIGSRSTPDKAAKSTYIVNNHTYIYQNSPAVNETFVNANWILPNLENRVSLNFLSLTETNYSQNAITQEGPVKIKDSTIAAKILTKIGSAQLGLRYTNQLVLTTQATLPGTLHYKNNTFGTVQRLNWSSDEEWRSYSLFFLDHQISKKWKAGADTNWLYHFRDSSGVNLTTLTVQQERQHWTTTLRQGQDYLFSTDINEIDYWTSIAFGRDLGREWLRLQIIPTLYWKEENHYQRTSSISINLILNFDS